MKHLRDLILAYAEVIASNTRLGVCSTSEAMAMLNITLHVTSLIQLAVQEEREACCTIAMKHLCPAHPLGIGIPDAIVRDIRLRSPETPGVGEE